MLDRKSTKLSIADWSKPRQLMTPSVLFIADVVLWLICLYAVLQPWHPIFAIGASVMLGLSTFRLFIIGHEACHGAFVASPRLNKVMGRLAFLPSLIPFAYWEVGHNVAHHAYTNFRKLDYVWAPFSPQEYLALPRWRRALERFYRGGFGFGLYFICEVWNTWIFFPSAKHQLGKKKAFVWDTLLVCLFLAGLTFLSTTVALSTGQSVVGTLFLAVFLPWLIYTHLMGLSIYLQHTHQNVRWYDDRGEWAADRGFITTTVHLLLPKWCEWFMLNVMDHTAHHVDMSISFENLPAAQAMLEKKFPQHVQVQQFSLGWYAQTANRCQAYDYRSHAWLSFSEVEQQADFWMKTSSFEQLSSEVRGVPDEPYLLGK